MPFFVMRAHEKSILRAYKKDACAQPSSTLRARVFHEEVTWVFVN